MNRIWLQSQRERRQFTEHKHAQGGMQHDEKQLCVYFMTQIIYQIHLSVL